MKTLPPATEFTLSLFYFTVEPQNKEVRERLGLAIDTWRKESWYGAGPYTRQLVTATERALSSKPVDLPAALVGIAEIQKLASAERSMETQAELARAVPHTRWDERADLQ